MARIIVASYAVRFPVGGFLSWMLQWLVGFERLGHEAYFVEKAGWPLSCYDPRTRTLTDDPSFGMAAFTQLLECHGLRERLCFVDIAGTCHGLSRDQMSAVFRTADLFIDHLRVCEWVDETANVPLRVMVDGEPGYTQIYLEQLQAAGKKLPEMTAYYSVGMNIGTAACPTPTLGHQWRPVFDPVVTDLFPCLPPPPDGPFTTVMNWQAHEPIEYNGQLFGQKDVEFTKFISLPGRVRSRLELAIAGNQTPTKQLQQYGWHLRNAQRVTASFDSWKDYILRSRGEFSVCKNIFVATNSGFFSDRSAAYLACGRPVVMQETGFSSHLPCGRGLFAVQDVQEAADAIEEVSGNYNQHSRWAREIACEYLEATKVLGRFLNELGI